MSTLNTVKQNKKFGYAVSLLLIALAVIQVLWKHPLNWILLSGGLLLLCFTIKIPQLLTPFRRLWEKFGHIMGVINTYILLLVVYFLTITPLSLFMRLLGKDILKLKRNNQDTYWQSADPTTEFGMKNQF